MRHKVVSKQSSEIVAIPAQSFYPIPGTNAWIAHRVNVELLAMCRDFQKSPVCELENLRGNPD